jgi:hypothetical protein
VNQHGVIGRASLPLDRFCALTATTGGELTTVPLAWPGGDLVLNADTRSRPNSHPHDFDGEIAVELLESDGRPIPSWSGEHSAVFRGNTHSRGRIFDGRVTWSAGGSMSEMTGRTIRIRFRIRRGSLFTFSAV